MPHRLLTTQSLLYQWQRFCEEQPALDRLAQPVGQLVIPKTRLERGMSSMYLPRAHGRGDGQAQPPPHAFNVLSSIVWALFTLGMHFALLAGPLSANNERKKKVT
jgi:hypothetical protein